MEVDDVLISIKNPADPSSEEFFSVDSIDRTTKMQKFQPPFVIVVERKVKKESGLFSGCFGGSKQKAIKQASDDKHKAKSEMESAEQKANDLSEEMSGLSTIEKDLNMLSEEVTQERQQHIAGYEGNDAAALAGVGGWEKLKALSSRQHEPVWQKHRLGKELLQHRFHGEYKTGRCRVSVADYSLHMSQDVRKVYDIQAQQKRTRTREK